MQLKLAAKRGHPVALILGSDEFAAGKAQLKRMASGESEELTWGCDTDVLAEAVAAAVASVQSRT